MKRIISLLCAFVMMFSFSVQMSNVFAEDALKTDKTVYEVGEPIMVTATASGTAWVGIYLRDDTVKDIASIRWYYVDKDGNTSGTAVDIRKVKDVNPDRAKYHDLPAGEYTIYLFEDDGWIVDEEIEITIVDSQAMSTPPSTPEAEYNRTASIPGIADGKLKITSNDELKPSEYIAYWADANGKLSEYTAIAAIPYKGKTTEFSLVKSSLIPAAADRILIYAKRGNLISENPASVMLPEGCNTYDFGTPVYEMQVVSDIHINPSDSHIHNKHFAAALEDIKKISPNSIGLFVNGDIADNGQTSDYQAFERLIEAAGDNAPKVYCAIGNHDLASGPYSDRVADFTKYTEPCTDKPYTDIWLEDTHFIFLGSEKPGLNAELSQAQLSWFEKALAEKRDPKRPIYVFLHQGLIDTVAGTFAYQKWHGVNQTEELSNILKKYPEVVLFTGHSHWEMDSAHNMKERDEKLPTILNTASVGYLWNDDSMATNAGIEGSQGYYIKAYSDKLVVMGRDFVNGLWIPSASYVIDFSSLKDIQVPADNTPSGSNKAPNEQGSEDSGSYTTYIIIGVVCAAALAVVIIILICNKKKKAK